MTVLLAVVLLTLGAFVGFCLCALLTVGKHSDQQVGEDNDN